MPVNRVTAGVGPVQRETLEALQNMRSDQEAAVLVSDLSGAWQCLLDGDLRVRAGDTLPPSLQSAVQSALAADRSQVVDAEPGRAFVQVFSPPLRMIIVGAVHIAQFLAPMAVLAGYQVEVVDPRRSFAADARFPGVSMHKIWPDDALQALRPDRRTAVVTLTHDPKIDDPALVEALKSDAFYVGSLGSRRTHAQRIERLAAAGVSQHDIERIHAPVGLDIRASSPAEIAVSALAQITARLRAG
ncbi:MAG: XdhC family protein [Pseudomonadota bacterium]